MRICACECVCLYMCSFMRLCMYVRVCIEHECAYVCKHVMHACTCICSYLHPSNSCCILGIRTYTTIRHYQHWAFEAYIYMRIKDDTNCTPRRMYPADTSRYTAHKAGDK